MSPHYFGDIRLSPDIRFCPCDVYSQPKVFCFCFWFFYYFIYLFMVVPGLGYCASLSLVAESGG